MPVLSPLRTRTLKTPRPRDSCSPPNCLRLCHPRRKDHGRLTKSFVLERTTATQRVMILAFQRGQSIPPRFRTASRRTQPQDIVPSRRIRVCTKMDTLCSPFQERADHGSPRLRGRIFTKTQSGANPALLIEAPPLATVVAGGSAVGPSGRDRCPGT